MRKLSGALGRRGWRPLADDERGAVLVITVVAMTAVIAIAAYALDTAVWFVHKRHLQTQADAAALAAAQTYQFNCGSAGDTTIKDIIHQYDGTGFTGSSTPTVNVQIPRLPTPSSSSGSGHLEYSAVNSNNFQGSGSGGTQHQSTPNDTGLTGSPCTDGLIDVKMTEQGLPSFLVPGISPTYVNAQARVGFQTASQVSGGVPFIEPLPTPSSVEVEFVDEANGDVLSTPGQVSLVSTDGGVTWTATGTPINFADPTNGSTTDTFPVGMRVAVNPSGGAASFPCTSSETCYDNSSSTSTTGVAFTRVWANSGSPGLNSGSTTSATDPVAPQASDVWLQPCVASGGGCVACPSSPSAATSNFFASSSATSEQLCANMVFATSSNPNATSLNCGQSSLTVKAGGTPVTMNCPNVATGSPNGTWSSGPLSVPAYSPPITNNGLMNVTMAWAVQNGCLPVGATGGTTQSTSSCAQTSGGSTVHMICGDGQGSDPKPCTGSFDNSTASNPETVQQAYSGAYSLLSGLSTGAGGIGPSNSGSISAASVTDLSGNEIQSIQNGMNTTVKISVSFYGYSPQTTVTNPTDPTELSLGGNKGNGFIGCGDSGNKTFHDAIVSGCPGLFTTTSVQPWTSACTGASSTNSTPGPAWCVNTKPGGGTGNSGTVAQALNDRINGSDNATKCASPNYWYPGNGTTLPGNAVASILSQSVNGTTDPRLVTLFYTDNITLPQASTPIPIRGFAEFYITGWGSSGNGNKGTDPCLTTSPITNPGSLSYASDELPPDNDDGIVMGHFVTYITPGATGSGQQCVNGTLGICVGVLTK